MYQYLAAMFSINEEVVYTIHSETLGDIRVLSVSSCHLHLLFYSELQYSFQCPAISNVILDRTLLTSLTHILTTL